MFQTLTTKVRRWRMQMLKPFGQSIPNGLRLSLGDLNPDVARALAAHFANVPGVEVLTGNLLDAGCDAILSPANSFGDMGGGIDKAIDDSTGGEAQRRLTAAIAEHHFGELPVGTALVVDLSGQRISFLVASPTMRTPGRVAGTINAYLAMRAAMVAVLRHNATSQRTIRSLAIPGLGTGVGGMDYDDAAEQMRTAYDSVIGGRWRQVVHPALAPYGMREG